MNPSVAVNVMVMWAGQRHTMRGDPECKRRFAGRAFVTEPLRGCRPATTQGRFGCATTPRTCPGAVKGPKVEQAKDMLHRRLMGNPRGALNRQRGLNWCHPTGRAWLHTGNHMLLPCTHHPRRRETAGDPSSDRGCPTAMWHRTGAPFQATSAFTLFEGKEGGWPRA